MIQHQPSCTDLFESGLIPCGQALEKIVSNLPAVDGHERIAITQARGRTLHDPIVSTFNVPAHTNSAVDGYAFHASDIPKRGTRRLSIKGLALAGKPFTGTLEPGQCLSIMTGAVLPKGLDAVAMLEHVEVETDFITIDGRHKAGQNIRQAGEDIEQGETILQPGKLLTPPDIGLIASLGIGEINVNRKLRVAVVSTGDEIFGIGQQPGVGDLYDSNRYSLIAALDRPDIEVINLGILEDNPTVLLDIFNEAGQYADLIVSSGGVSAGAADFTKTALQASGQVAFWKIAIKPGRPLAFGRIGNAAFFGLPGNPVAVLTTFYYFVLPALEKMLGISDKLIAPAFKARAMHDLRKKPGRTEIQRGIISLGGNDEWTVKTTGKQGSGILRSMSLANAFIILNHDSGPVRTGDWVTVQPFSALF